MGIKVLMIIDMVNDFIHPDGLLYFEDGKRIVPAIKDKLEKARNDDTLVIYLTDVHYEHEFDGYHCPFPKHCINRTWGANIIDELKPHDGERFTIVRKNKFSGFFQTNLDSYIMPPDEVEVVGGCRCIYFYMRHGHSTRYILQRYGCYCL
jgi:nicotinamidase-related amidase